MARKDIHRPSAIEPADYEFVAFDYLPSDGDPLGNAMFMADQRKYKALHMAKSGGHYSGHEHGGLCHICGSVNAIYSASFYHAKSNRYIKVGLDCAQKLECEGIEAFRKNVKKALEASAGKRKAKAILEKAGLAAAWSLYEAEAEYRKAFVAANKAWQEANPDAEPDRYGNVEGAPKFKENSRDESIVLEMIGKLIKYGDLSDKQVNFMGMLLKRISQAPELAAKRAEEKAAAAPVPQKAGRWLVEGEVLSIKEQESQFGLVLKMLVRNEAGWKVWGSIPSAIRGEVERGSVVQFVAAVSASPDDKSFGFFSRPAQAKVLNKAVAA